MVSSHCGKIAVTASSGILKDHSVFIIIRFVNKLNSTCLQSLSNQICIYQLSQTRQVAKSLCDPRTSCYNLDDQLQGNRQFVPPRYSER